MSLWLRVEVQKVLYQLLMLSLVAQPAATAGKLLRLKALKK